MGRTAVMLIGVSRVDGLGVLRAVDSGVAAMRDWARTQTTHIVEITDLDGSAVTVDRILGEVEALIADPLISRLVIYFSGHGVYASFSEYWLLSRASTHSHEAVNVAGSVVLAQALSIEHVVLISDACRTPAQTLAMAQITGTPMFPHRPAIRQTTSVDVFYGCLPGRPSIEVLHPDGSGYVAVFTRAIASALDGTSGEFVQDEGADGRFVRAHRLRELLPGRVRGILDELAVPLLHDVEPWSDVRSRPDQWVSRLPAGPAGGRGAGAGSGVETVSSRTDDVARSLRQALDDARDISGAPNEVPWMQSVPTWAELVIHVDGVGVERVHSPGWKAVFDDDPHGATILIESARGDAARAGSFTLQLADGGCLVVPLGRDATARVEAREGEIRSVAFLLPRFFRRRARRSEQLLRRAVEDAARAGMFAPDDGELEELLAIMRGRKDADPALALYTAYALQARGRYDEIAEMRTIMEMTTGWDFYDLELLCGFGAPRDGPHRGAVAPGYPALSQGWPLLFAADEATDEQRALDRVRRGGLWTSFTAEAWPLLTGRAGS
jgi:hypothetical protein